MALADYLTYALTATGFLFVASKVYSYVRLLSSIFLLRGTSLQKYGKQGSWAVITGASDGIGKEYAIQLARQGFSLVLVSRTESKLQEMAKWIEYQYEGMNVKAKYLAMDFSRNDDADFAKLEEMVKDLDVAILINNVGQSHNIPVSFVDTPKDEMNNIITINCFGTLKVTKIVALIMQQRKKGLILTMGSFGGLLPSPLLATYSGSKAFLQYWSAALGAELKRDGIDVELVLSYLVTSAMSKVKKPSALIPTPREFVSAVLTKVGRSGGAQNFAFTSTPYWSHALLHWWIEALAGVGSAFAVKKNLGFHEDIRRRALKKMAREQAAKAEKSEKA